MNFAAAITPAPTFASDLLWRFAGYLAGGASVGQAALWSGAAVEDGDDLLEELQRIVGWQAQ